jgi:multiple sugar transport system substrate-binding protein
VKKLLLIITCILLLNSFSGCADDKKDNTPARMENAERTKLSLLFYYEGQERFSLVNNLCNAFNNQQKESEAIPEFVPFEELKKKLLTGMAQGDPPDLVIYDVPDYAYLAERGILEDITDNIKNWQDFTQFYENSIEACTYKGRIYGMPIGQNCLALFYNKKMLEDKKLSPPQTWSELKTTALKLSNGNVHGMGICAQNSEQGMFQFLPWLYSAGADTSDLQSAEAVKAFTFLAELVDQGAMSKEIINWSQADVMKQFANGKVAMMLNGPWQLSELRIKAPELEYGIVRIPMDKKSVTILGGENISVVKGQNKDKAFEFLKFFCSAENVRTFTKSMAYFPSRKDVPVDEELNRPGVSLFGEEVHKAIPRGPDPNWPEISKIVTGELHEVLTQRKSPEAAAKAAQADMEKLAK